MPLEDTNRWRLMQGFPWEYLKINVRRRQKQPKTKNMQKPCIEMIRTYLRHRNHPNMDMNGYEWIQTCSSHSWCLDCISLDKKMSEYNGWICYPVTTNHPKSLSSPGLRADVSVRAFCSVTAAKEPCRATYQLWKAKYDEGTTSMLSMFTG